MGRKVAEYHFVDKLLSDMKRGDLKDEGQDLIPQGFAAEVEAKKEIVSQAVNEMDGESVRSNLKEYMMTALVAEVVLSLAKDRIAEAVNIYDDRSIKNKRVKMRRLLKEVQGLLKTA